MQETQILRQSRVPMQKLPASGCSIASREACRACRPSAASASRLGRRVAGLGLEVRAIDVIAKQGVADMGQVHPDLMGPPGLELAGQNRRDRLAVRP